jgi:REP element-mobilizing transposase RayT
MARQWRITFPGAFYHIMSRGNERQDIFRCDDDRKMFLDLIGDFSERFEIDMFAYVLMDNHFHLLLRTRQANLPKAMQWLGTTYTRKFNNRHDRSGHLFQGRYKSILVENDQYLLHLSCYIHRNPLRAGIISRLADYRWSSYPSYGYARKTPKWLDTSLILNLMTNSRTDPHLEYREKVQQYSDETKNIWEDVENGLIYGSEDFVTDIRSRFLSEDKNPELPQCNQIAKTITTRELLNNAAAALNFDLKAAATGKRVTPEDKDKRDLLIFLLWESGRLTNKEIGSYFGLTYSSVSRRVAKTRKRLPQENELNNTFEKLKSLIKV